ncbi:MAG: hypothetical protein ACXIUD_02045 [Mongoliitalea sp.]
MNEPIRSYVKIIVVWVVFLLPLTSFAQDIIWKENGEVLDVFIHKMRFEKIVYRIEPDRTSKKLKTRYRDISKVERINGDIHYYLEGRENRKMLLESKKNGYSKWGQLELELEC